MAVWNGGAATFAARRPAAQTRHFGGSPGLVDKNQPVQIEITLPLKPERPGRADVVAFLLAGVSGFF